VEELKPYREHNGAKWGTNYQTEKKQSACE